MEERIGLGMETGKHTEAIRARARAAHRSRGATAGLLLSLAWAATYAHPTSAAPDEAKRNLAESKTEVRKVAQQILLERRTVSQRADQARILRASLTEIRNELKEISSDPSRKGQSGPDTRLRTLVDELDRADRRNPRVSQARFFARQDTGPGAELATMMSDLRILAQDPRAGSSELPRLIDVIDRALAAPLDKASRSYKLEALGSREKR